MRSTVDCWLCATRVRGSLIREALQCKVHSLYRVDMAATTDHLQHSTPAVNPVQSIFGTGIL